MNKRAKKKELKGFDLLSALKERPMPSVAIREALEGKHPYAAIRRLRLKGECVVFNGEGYTAAPDATDLLYALQKAAHYAETRLRNISAMTRRYVEKNEKALKTQRGAFAKVQDILAKIEKAGGVL